MTRIGAISVQYAAENRQRIPQPSAMSIRAEQLGERKPVSSSIVV